jgi:crotonobetaine/carnitine-CoA ligase
MAQSAQEEFQRRFGIAVYSEIYGQTECNPITANPWRDDLRRRESMGRAVPGLQVAVHDDDGRPVPPGVVGEVVVRPLEPEVMFQGYWGKPEATVEVSRGLWHHTGDNAVVDADGYLTFRDRKKDSMRRRGENVSSIELERAILEHPGVAAVVVHAVPSPLGEDDIKACLIPVEGAQIDPVELFDFFKSHLPYFAVPRYFELVDEFPVNAMGRVLKHELRARGIGDAVDFESLGLTIAKSERR